MKAQQINRIWYHHLRQGEVWVVRSLRGMEQQLSSPYLGVDHALADLYALVSWLEEGGSEDGG